MTLRKGPAIIQALLIGALTTLMANIDRIPAKYQLAVIVAVGAVQAAVPPPMKRATLTDGD